MGVNVLIPVESGGLGRAIKKFMELHGQECGPSLRRHAHFVGPAERRRIKGRKARKRVQREVTREARAAARRTAR